MHTKWLPDPSDNHRVTFPAFLLKISRSSLSVQDRDLSVEEKNQVRCSLFTVSARSAVDKHNVLGFSSGFSTISLKFCFQDWSILLKRKENYIWINILKAFSLLTGKSRQYTVV